MDCIFLCRALTLDQNEVLEHLTGACKAIADMIYHLELQQADVWKIIRWHLAHIATDQSQEGDSKKTIANRAGLDRNSYANFIKEPPPVAKPSNIAALITVASAKSDQGVISIKDFLAVAAEVMKSSLSPQKALEELISKGIVTFKEDSATELVINNEGIYASGMTETYLKIFSSTLNKVIQTLLHNKDAKEHEQLFQANFYSTQMPLNEQRIFKQFTKDEFWALRVKLREKIAELENPNLPVGAFSEVGVSLFQTYLSKSKSN